MLPKKINKRKFKHTTRKTIRYLGTSCLIFGLSLIILTVIFTPKETIISPISTFISLPIEVRTQTNDQETATVKEILDKNNIKYTTIDVYDDQIVFGLDTGEEVVLSRSKDLQSQIASLQLTIAHLTIEGKHISRIDLRFDRPVVAF